MILLLFRPNLLCHFRCRLSLLCIYLSPCKHRTTMAHSLFLLRRIRTDLTIIIVFMIIGSSYVSSSRTTTPTLISKNNVSGIHAFQQRQRSTVKRFSRTTNKLIALTKHWNNFQPYSFITGSTTRIDERISNNELSELLTSRLPTSVDDQVRQAAESLKRATSAGIYRHTIKLLLPVIGATELDDWPGGSRQQMEAATPLVQDILVRILSSSSITNMNDDGKNSAESIMPKISTTIIDESDGVAAIYVQARDVQDDSCTVVLPTAECVTETIQRTIEKQVGMKRNLIFVNPQWRRKSDFGGNTFFGFTNNNRQRRVVLDYVEQFIPTFSLTNFICEGESIRVLRTYPGPWRVFLQITDTNNNTIDWIQIGTKAVLDIKPLNWDEQMENQKDGGMLFNYGQPSYQEIMTMITTAPNYKAKNPAERAAAAFTFIKDSL